MGPYESKARLGGRAQTFRGSVGRSGDSFSVNFWSLTANPARDIPALIQEHEDQLRPEVTSVGQIAGVLAQQAATIDRGRGDSRAGGCEWRTAVG